MCVCLSHTRQILFCTVYLCVSAVLLQVTGFTAGHIRATLLDLCPEFVPVLPNTVQKHCCFASEVREKKKESGLPAFFWFTTSCSFFCTHTPQRVVTWWSCNMYLYRFFGALLSVYVWWNLRHNAGALGYYNEDKGFTAY